MAYRNKTYLCFDADNDMHYYRLCLAWNQSDHSSFNFVNAHDLNRLLSTSSEQTIKRKLRERLNNTKVFVILVGEHTRYLYRFVRWEMEQALNLKLPVVVVNLNGKRSMDAERCPPILREEIAVHVSFNAAILEYALDNWPSLHASAVRGGADGPHYYDTPIYQRLGL